jgi:Glycosyltransferases, probably involved in cell wall biogenesis
LNSVSTIIPVHKYNQTTKKAILSAINQNYAEQKIHVIVNSTEKNLINKISTDFGQKIEITKIDDLGVSFARNKGIELSTSDFIAFLDSDDTWYQDKLSRQINYMIENNHLICGTLMDYRT